MNERISKTVSTNSLKSSKFKETIEDKKTFSFGDFADSSTLHGISRVASNNNCWRRGLWFIAIISSLFLLLVQAIADFLFYFS